MKKVRIGYIYDSRKPGKEEKIFLKLAKKRGVEIIMFNTAEEIDEIKIKERAKLCDIVYNDTAMYITMELAKMLEAIGTKVIEPTKVYYYIEDKWLFYILCKKNNIPTPETILLSDDINAIREELSDFNHWPVILKRVYGERGEFVDKANNLDDAVEKVRRLWLKGNERLPILAQEFIKSNSYRITTIGGKIVQTALKKHHGWKATGCYAKHFYKFKVNSSLKKLVKKVLKATKINICGIDMLKKNGKWVLIEVNAEPSFDFYNCEQERLIDEVIKLLIKLAKKK